MTEFQHIDFQTYTAVQEAITVLEDMDKLPFRVSKMGSGLAAAYAARLRELAETPVSDEDNTPSIDSIRKVCGKITDMLQVLKWTWETLLVVADAYDYTIREAIDAMENGCPFAATLHDHADHTNLHVRWWIGGKEYVCEYKLTTCFVPGQEDETIPEVAFTRMKEDVYDSVGSPQYAAGEYLKVRFFPCPCANERVDMWWSLSGRTDQTMFHWALMPEADYWMQLS